MPKDLPRLGRSVISIQREVAVDVRLFRDDAGFRVVAGTLKAFVAVECQRCLQSCNHDLVGTLNLALVLNEDQMNSLPKNYEAWLLEDGEGDLYEAIEDELILALPIVAYHEPSDCHAAGAYSTGEFDEAEFAPKQSGVFEALGALKGLSKTKPDDKP